MKPVPLIVTFVLGLALGALGAASRSAGWFADSRGAPEAAAPTAAPVASSSAQGQRCPDEAQLRRVVREELAAAAAIPASVPGSQPAGAGPKPPDSGDLQAHVDRVNRQVDEYIRAGAISQAEMAALQEEISRLEPAAQRAAIGKLVRAMNSGALAGNL